MNMFIFKLNTKVTCKNMSSSKTIFIYFLIKNTKFIKKKLLLNLILEIKLN